MQKQFDNKIVVLNYNDICVIAPASSKTYVFEPSEDDVPTLDTMPFSDVEYINSHSNAFRTGLLFFKEEQQKDVYNELKIFDWENILTNQKIENILLNPTIDGLQKIVDIKDDSMFERVRRILVNLKNSNNYDLSNRVINVVEARHQELQRRILKTRIVLQPRDAQTNKINSSEVDLLKAQLAEMQKMMAQMMASQNLKESTKDDTKSVNKTKKKSVGRPSTKK